MQYTAEQIIALSPDAGSAKNGTQLANVRNWSNLGCNDLAVWGECKGSGANPYKAVIALTGPAFKCSCPSRKFPCKHGIGLFLLHIQQVSSFTSHTPPDWADDWLQKRNAKAENAAKKAAEPVSEEVQAKRAKQKSSRAEERLQNVVQGMDDLGEWIRDIVRTGLAGLETKGAAFSHTQAARLVDSQAGTLATLVRELGDDIGRDKDWHSLLLQKLADFYLLTQAFSQIKELPQPLQEELKNLAGMGLKKEDLLGQEGVKDVWMVMSVKTERDEKLNMRRVWLQGMQTQQSALVLDFAFGAASFDMTLVAGNMLKGEVVFFPSAFLQRAVFKDVQSVKEKARPQGLTLADSLQQYSDALASYFWLREMPVLLEQATPVRDGNTWHLLTAGQELLPLQIQDTQGWHWLALSGGAFTPVFGEWNGRVFAPLSLWADDKLQSLQGGYGLE